MEFESVLDLGVTNTAYMDICRMSFSLVLQRFCDDRVFARGGAEDFQCADNSPSLLSGFAV